MTAKTPGTDDHYCGPFGNGLSLLEQEAKLGRTYAGNRGYYLTGSTWPSAELNADQAKGRLPHLSIDKDASWKDLAAMPTVPNEQSANPYTARYSKLGNAILAWYNAIPGRSGTAWKGNFFWGLGHEIDALLGTGSEKKGTGQHHRDAVRAIKKLWGNISPKINEIARFGFNFISGTAAEFAEMWPSGGGVEDRWMRANCEWVSIDPYNWYGESAPTVQGGRCLASDCLSCGHCATGRGTKWAVFADPDRMSSISVFRNFIDEKARLYGVKPMLWETGCTEAAAGGALDPATGKRNPKHTKALWLLGLGDYIEGINKPAGWVGKWGWPECWGVDYWSNEEKCPRWIDSSQEAWDAWVQLLSRPFFNPARGLAPLAPEAVLDLSPLEIPVTGGSLTATLSGAPNDTAITFRLDDASNLATQATGPANGQPAGGCTKALTVGAVVEGDHVIDAVA